MNVLLATNVFTSMRIKMEGESSNNFITYKVRYVVRVVDVGPPKKPLRRANAEGNLTLVQRLLLYDFLEVCAE